MRPSLISHAGHEFRGVARDRETDSLRRPNHRGVNSNHFARGIRERPSGVSRIQRCIGLDNVVDQSARLRVHRATERTNHSGGDARLKPKRITNGDRDLTDTQCFRIGQPHMRKLRRINANHGEISIRIVSDKLGARFPAVGKIDYDFARTMHDVAIGQNKTIRRDDESRAAAAARAVGPRFDVHHRRRDPVDRTDDGARIFVEQSDISLAGADGPGACLFPAVSAAKT